MELVYTVETKDSIEIIMSLLIPNALFLIGIAIMFFFRKSIKIAGEQQYTNIFLLIFTSFILLSSATDYYLSSKLNKKLKVALSNQKKCDYIEGIPKQYKYIYSNIKKREWFLINNIHFEIQNSDNVIVKKYPKLIKNKTLRLKIEYIDFPRFNPTIVRVWKLP